MIRVLGRMLFSTKDHSKSVKVVPVVSKDHMFGKLILQKPNVLITMDSPNQANHLD